MDTIKRLAVKASVKKKIAGPLAQPDATSVARPQMKDPIVGIPSAKPTATIRKFYINQTVRKKLAK